MFKLLQDELPDTEGMLTERWAASALIDKIGLYTVEVYLQSREEIIARQQHEMLELSTPVVQLWDGIIALPLIGTLDSARTQVVMETLLQSIVDTGSRIAVIDITGVSTVDTWSHSTCSRPPRRRVSWARSASSAGSAHRSRRPWCTSGSASTMSSPPARSRMPAARVPHARSDGDDARLQLTGPAWRGSRSSDWATAWWSLIQVDMHDRLALALQDDLTTKVVEYRARGVLVDISSVEMVDSFIGRMLGTIAQMTRALGAETVVVGMQPAVAITLVELGLTLSTVQTALDIDSGLRLLESLIAADLGEDGDDHASG